MPKLEERISSLESKLKELKTRQQRIDARARALASRRARQEETRRKILIGSMILARVQADQLDHADLENWLTGYLTRAEDRALFDLPPLPESPA